MEQKPRKKVTFCQGEIWVSDKVKFCFWYPGDKYESLLDILNESNRRKDDFWFGDSDIEVKEISLETWDGKFLFHFQEDEIEGLYIPWNKVVAWNLCSRELKTNK